MHSIVYRRPEMCMLICGLQSRPCLCRQLYAGATMAESKENEKGNH